MSNVDPRALAEFQTEQTEAGFYRLRQHAGPTGLGYTALTTVLFPHEESEPPVMDAVNIASVLTLHKLLTVMQHVKMHTTAIPDGIYVPRIWQVDTKSQFPLEKVLNTYYEIFSGYREDQQKADQNDRLLNAGRVRPERRNLIRYLADLLMPAPDLDTPAASRGSSVHESWFNDPDPRRRQAAQKQNLDRIKQARLAERNANSWPKNYNGFSDDF